MVRSLVLCMLLAVLAGSAAHAQVTPEETAWLRRSAHILADHDSADADLRFLGPLLHTRRVVQLGTSRTNPGEIIRMHTRLGRYLHETLGYDVLVLEGGLADCGAAHLAADSLSLTAMLQACSRRVCASEEMAELFAYVRQTRATAHPLVLIGNDNMPTGNLWPGFLRSAAERLRYPRLQALLEADSLYRGIWVDNLDDAAYIAAARQAAGDVFPDFLHHLTQNCARLGPPAPGGVDPALWLERAIRTRLESLAPEWFRDRRSIEEARDALMARNLVWMVDTLFAGRKLVVIAANGHVAEAYSLSNGGFRRSGERLVEALGDAVYTVGTYAGGGEVPHFREREAPAPLPGSIEDRLGRLGAAAAFLDLHPPDSTARPARWLREQVPSYQEFRFPQRFPPASQYDALLYVRRVSPAHALASPL